MKNENYTSLFISKYLSKKMPFESEMWWNRHYTWKSGEFKKDSKWYVHKAKGDYPALTFTDLLQYLKLYGEREGWSPVPCSYVDWEDCHPATPEWYKLFDMYIRDNLTIGTHCESFLLDVIK